MPGTTQPPAVELGALAATAGIELPPALDGRREIRGLEFDSRRVESGYLFFAFPGAQTDGRRYAGEALGRGVVAVVSESEAPPGLEERWIQVPHGRRALALMARRFYAGAVAGVRLVGVTGTNGKTTTSTLIDSILRAAGHITALVGTIEYRVAGEPRRAVNTTPESVELYRLFAELAKRGGTWATMEASSHALALGRIHGFHFQAAVFCNLSRDHLDFHGTMEDYFAAKCELFRGQAAPPPRHAILNADDEWAPGIPLSAATEPLWYGLGSRAGLRAENVSLGIGGVEFDAVWAGGKRRVQSALTGHMNVYNLLAAFATGLALEIPADDIVRGLSLCRAVPGRFERVDAGQPFLVVVDYAHTDDALRRALRAAREVVAGRVITVFGCGGDRDREKRPLMGAAAGELSDFVVLTSDNPRTEDPLAIIEGALAGLKQTRAPYLVDADRARAIRAALERARPGDAVLVAGKGHETYQVLREGTIHFDDREAVRAALAELGYRGERAGAAS